MEINAETIELLKQGDEKEWDKFYNGVRGHIYRYVNERLGSYPATIKEDLVSQVFIRLLTNIGQYDHNKPFLPWLKTIVNNLCTDWYRKAKDSILLEVPITDNIISPDYMDFIDTVDEYSSGLSGIEKKVYDLILMGHTISVISLMTGMNMGSTHKMVKEIKDNIKECVTT